LAAAGDGRRDASTTAATTTTTTAAGGLERDARRPGPSLGRGALSGERPGDLGLLGRDGRRQVGVDGRERVGLGQRPVESGVDLRGERLLLLEGGVEIAEAVLHRSLAAGRPLGRR